MADGFIIDNATGRRYMAHNSDIANSLVCFGYAILTEGENVEYRLLRDIVGKWKCDAVTALGGGPVSPDQQAIDMSINSGQRQSVQTTSWRRRGGYSGEADRAEKLVGGQGPELGAKVDKVLEVGSKQGTGRRWRPKEPLLGS